MESKISLSIEEILKLIDIGSKNCKFQLGLMTESEFNKDIEKLKNFIPEDSLIKINSYFSDSILFKEAFSVPIRGKNECNDLLNKLNEKNYILISGYRKNFSVKIFKKETDFYLKIFLALKEKASLYNEMILQVMDNKYKKYKFNENINDPENFTMYLDKDIESSLKITLDEAFKIIWKNKNDIVFFEDK